MKKSYQLIILVLIIITIILFKLTGNKVDPIWAELENLDYSKIKTIEKSEQELQLLFNNFHHRDSLNTVNALKLIGTPYVPIMEFSKYKKYVDALKKEHRIVLSGVEGGGSTTLVEKIAKFVAVDDSRILNIKCSPQFDLIYHKRFIGEYINGEFKKGELLLFWEKCVAQPNKNFIVIFDDFDKINPETLFGPDLWENLSNKKYKLFVAGNEVVIPNNFYMISTTLSAVGSRILLHNEHFKRIGTNYFIEPNTIELALYLKRVKNKLKTKVNKEGIAVLKEKDQKKYNALINEKNVLEFLYLFKKTNQNIDSDISHNSQLAQWSNLRKLFLPEEKNEVIETFISHVNAISPNKTFNVESFNSIKYTFKNNGLLKGSSPLATSFKVFKEWGFLTEFVVAICFALITALISVYINSKRKKQITKFLTKSESIYTKFEHGDYNANQAIDKLSHLKLEIEQQTKKNKVSFPEAIFFYNSVRSKVNSIEIKKNINATFLILMDVFMEDGILSKSEYDKLITFLEKIKKAIPNDDYLRMSKEVNAIWEKCGESDTYTN